MPGRSSLSSVLAAAVVPLLIGQAPPPAPAEPPPSPEQTKKAIAACGVPPGNIRIAYEDLFQSDVVTISDLGGTGAARIRCVKKAVHVWYVVLVEAEDQRRAYYAQDRRIAPVSGLRRAAIQTQLRDIAAGCGLPAGALRLSSSGRIRVRPPTDVRYETVDCALARMREGGLSDHLAIGFVGNEAEGEPRR